MRISDWSSDVCSSDLLKYAGEASRLVIGRRNTIREHVTMNPGTAGGGMETRVGDDCLFMVGAHVAHDCRIGDRVVLANNATLARSEEHTSELQSLMRISYAVSCLKKKTTLALKQ